MDFAEVEKKPSCNLPVGNIRNISIYHLILSLFLQGRPHLTFQLLSLFYSLGRKKSERETKKKQSFQIHVSF